MSVRGVMESFYSPHVHILSPHPAKNPKLYKLYGSPDRSTSHTTRWVGILAPSPLNHDGHRDRAEWNVRGLIPKFVPGPRRPVDVLLTVAAPLGWLGGQYGETRGDVPVDPAKECQCDRLGGSD
jgi:hypothetical protein